MTINDKIMRTAFITSQPKTYATGVKFPASDKSIFSTVVIKGILKGGDHQPENDVKYAPIDKQ